jgi:hypothetical protein
MDSRLIFTVAIQAVVAIGAGAWFFSAYWRIRAFRNRDDGDVYRKKSNTAPAVFLGWAVGFGGYWLSEWLGYRL